ncbi:MAG TPA: uroporphyrinogen-III synthase [Dehalococcoidia bacterium]|nr:uroporphyrinogen-III synthase [Dehalococcoidia bacterium]
MAIAAIGPITADAVRAAGLTVDIMPDEHTVPALVAAIARRYGQAER